MVMAIRLSGIHRAERVLLVSVWVLILGLAGFIGLDQYEKTKGKSLRVMVRHQLMTHGWW